jgi:uncharacterized protein (TIGR02145 family)
MKKTLFWGCMLAGLLSLPSHAQVTIGSGIKPVGGALLDLKETTPAADNTNATKGLALPRVSLTDPDKLYPMFTGVYDAAEDAKHTGLTVYNLNRCFSVAPGKGGPGVYVWSGTEWQYMGKANDISGDPDPDTVSPSGEMAVAAVTGSYFTLGPVSVGFTSGSPAIAYRWYRSADGGSNYTAMTGENANTLTTQEPAPGTYKYYCEMTNADCPGASVRTGVYTVTPPLAGTGNFSGKTCFDIAYSNFDGECGLQPARQSQKTDFSLTGEQDPQAGTSSPVYTGTQVYTFTPSGNVSNVRFVYVDASGKAIESITPKADYSGNISSGSLCKAVVVYKASLNEYLRGKTRNEAVKPEIYVIYNDASNNTGTDRFIKLTASLQDCACCGAATTTTGGWLNFMCHNLGADEFLDPFTYAVGNADGSGGTLGYLYQWGRVADGHEKRNSPRYPAENDNTQDGSVPNTALDANGQVLSTLGAYRKFIKNYSNTYRYDWRQTQKNDLWGDGSTNEVMSKAANDPCPPGWKVPSQKQWASIYTNATTPNIWTWADKGYKVGSSLYLPAAGFRNSSNGTLSNVGALGYYWSSTVSGTYAYRLSFSNNNVNPANIGDYRASGFSVRCVSE